MLHFGIVSLVWEEYVEEADIDFSKLYAAGPVPATFSSTKASFQTTLNLFKQSQQTSSMLWLRMAVCFWAPRIIQACFSGLKECRFLSPPSLCTHFSLTLTPRHNMLYCYTWSTCKSLRNCKKNSRVATLFDQFISPTLKRVHLQC